MIVLGIDPGETNGWCFLNENGTPVPHRAGEMPYGQVRYGDMTEFLESVPEGVDVVVIEDYRIFAKKAKAHVGNRLVTIEMIGAIRHWAATRGIKIVTQESRILPVAEKLLGKKMSTAGKHSETHWLSAYLHAGYWLVKEGLFFPNIDESRYRPSTYQEK